MKNQQQAVCFKVYFPAEKERGKKDGEREEGWRKGKGKKKKKGERGVKRENEKEDPEQDDVKNVTHSSEHFFQ